MDYTKPSYNNIVHNSDINIRILSQNNREYNIYHAIFPSITIVVKNFDLNFEVSNSELRLSSSDNYVPHAIIIANYDISHLIESQILKLELLIPYLDEIVTIYENADQQAQMLFKQGRQTKRAN